VRKVLIFACVFFFGLGCRATKLESQAPEVFGGSREELVKRFEAIKPGQTTRSELVEAGWDFTGKNVHSFPGPAAMKKLFGEGVFHNGLTAKDRIDHLLKELNNYEMVVFTYRSIETVSDRFFFSRQRKHRFGEELSLALVFERDLVVYKANDLNRPDIHEVDEAFAEGILRYLLPVAVGYAAGQIVD